jgi:hypothetical protein
MEEAAPVIVVIASSSGGVVEGEWQPQSMRSCLMKMPKM